MARRSTSGGGQCLCRQTNNARASLYVSSPRGLRPRSLCGIATHQLSKPACRMVAAWPSGWRLRLFTDDPKSKSGAVPLSASRSQTSRQVRRCSDSSTSQAADPDWTSGEGCPAAPGSVEPRTSPPVAVADALALAKCCSGIVRAASTQRTLRARARRCRIGPR